jgi:hypothetical protein
VPRSSPTRRAWDRVARYFGEVARFHAEILELIPNKICSIQDRRCDRSIRRQPEVKRTGPPVGTFPITAFFGTYRSASVGSPFGGFDCMPIFVVPPG